MSTFRSTNFNVSQNDVKVNETRKDTVNGGVSLPNEQHATTPENNTCTCGKMVQQNNYEKSTKKNNNGDTLDKEKSQEIQGKDGCILSSSVNMSSTTHDDVEYCDVCRKQNDTECSCNQGQKNLPSNSGIRKYFKSQSNDITEKGEGGNVTPQNMHCIHDKQDITDECLPVLKYEQIFDNFKRIQEVSRRNSK